MGERLAEKLQRLMPDHDIDAVIPIPDTARTAASSLAAALGVPFREGFVKNRYIGRTFIMPGQGERAKSVRRKLNPIELEFRSKNVLLVDDSIVRGTTSQQIIQMARDVGARKVYFASAAPPVRYPNVYGIDMPAVSELVAHGRSEEEIRDPAGRRRPDLPGPRRPDRRGGRGQRQARPLRHVVLFRRVRHRSRRRLPRRAADRRARTMPSRAAAAPERMPRLLDLARECIDCADPARKLELTAAAHQALCQGRASPAVDAAPPPRAIAAPGRPERPRLVPPRDLARRGLGTPDGRAALVHAVAHIEFNAINLAWDAVYRFRGLPDDYYRDWAAVAADEARHYALLSARLADLGHVYGDFDAHDGLWQMAEATAGSVLARMALVPRVLEARGLDVTPGMILRLRTAGDDCTADILEVILHEEVAHVAAGSRWFRWCCARDGLEPAATFRGLLERHLRTGLKGPFNLDARRAAGFGEDELEALGATG